MPLAEDFFSQTFIRRLSIYCNDLARFDEWCSARIPAEPLSPAAVASASNSDQNQPAHNSSTSSFQEPASGVVSDEHRVIFCRRMVLVQYKIIHETARLPCSLNDRIEKIFVDSSVFPRQNRKTVRLQIAEPFFDVQLGLKNPGEILGRVV